LLKDFKDLKEQKLDFDTDDAKTKLEELLQRLEKLNHLSHKVGDKSALSKIAQKAETLKQKYVLTQD